MIRSLASSPRRGAVLAVACVAAAWLAGCSTIEDFMSGDKIDYHSQGAKTPGLEVPPDLTQLSRDPRYQVPASGSVSATTFQAGATAAAVATPQVVGVAPKTIGQSTIERSGDSRWLKTSLPPDQLWPQLEAFWKENGFILAKDEPTTGVMETDWAENRAKLPGDIIRNTVGKVFDSAYSTGERDRFRTRVERDGDGSDIYISHRGMVETYIGERKEETIWQPRPADPQLEAEFLSRLMIKLGVGAEVAKATVDAKPAPGVVRARMLAGQPGPTLQVDDNFDRAWRRVGLALDRSGFTVEDRDRGQGIYFVRYVDPRTAGKEEPGVFTKMWNWIGSKKSDDSGVAKYRVVVKAAGDACTVTVQNNQGAPENGDAGKRISSMLLDELK